MDGTGRLIVLGSLTIVAFDVVASFAALAIGFHYADAYLGSWLIYAIFGFLIGRRSSVAAAAFGVAFIAGVEATIGWAVSWAIGPGRMPGGVPSVTYVLGMIVGVECIGAVIGAAAGFVGRRNARAGS